MTSVSLRHPYRHGLWAVVRLVGGPRVDQLIARGMRHRQYRLK